MICVKEFRTTIRLETREDAMPHSLLVLGSQQFFKTTPLKMIFKRKKILVVASRLNSANGVWF